MKRFLLITLVIISLDLLLQRCANPASPSGGPKDTIPPTLINVIPSTGTTNFKEQTLTLEFDEFINADKIQQNLIITPKTDIKYKHSIKKTQLTLRFEELFLDSTTYSLNFFDGVTDITERNPVPNLYIAFSTGPYIDSMKVQGTVSNIFTQELMSGFTVGLYPLTDTLNFLEDSPTYFTTTDEAGSFMLEYIKSGKYKIISFNDDNRNLLLDPETEEHGFLSDTLSLHTRNDTIQYEIRTQLINVKPIRYINSRPVAQYIEAKYSREIAKYTIVPSNIPSNIIGEKKDVIRVYNYQNTYNYGDSLTIYLTAFDSLQNSSIDTIKTVFLESNRKKSTFSSSIKNKKNEVLKENQIIKMSFNKPIISTDTSSFSFIRDSTFEYTIRPELSWNYNKTELTIQTKISPSELFSELQQSIPNDTAKIDTTENKTKTNDLSNLQRDENAKSPAFNIDFQVDKGAFISVDNDTTKTLTTSFNSEGSKSFGSLNLTISTEHSSFIVQLLSNSKVKYQNRNLKEISFSKIEAGTYAIRVLIDSNNDGEWSYGNIIKNEQPEHVFMFPDETSVRENWELDLEISF